MSSFFLKSRSWCPNADQPLPPGRPKPCAWGSHTAALPCGHLPPWSAEGCFSCFRYSLKVTGRLQPTGFCLLPITPSVLQQRSYLKKFKPKLVANCSVSGQPEVGVSPAVTRASQAAPRHPGLAPVAGPRPQSLLHHVSALSRPAESGSSASWL